MKKSIFRNGNSNFEKFDFQKSDFEKYQIQSEKNVFFKIKKHSQIHPTKRPMLKAIIRFWGKMGNPILKKQEGPL